MAETPACFPIPLQPHPQRHLPRLFPHRHEHGSANLRGHLVASRTRQPSAQPLPRPRFPRERPARPRSWEATTSLVAQQPLPRLRQPQLPPPSRPRGLVRSDVPPRPSARPRLRQRYPQESSCAATSTSTGSTTRAAVPLDKQKQLRLKGQKGGRTLTMSSQARAGRREQEEEGRRAGERATDGTDRRLPLTFLPYITRVLR